MAHVDRVARVLARASATALAPSGPAGAPRAPWRRIAAIVAMATIALILPIRAWAIVPAPVAAATNGPTPAELAARIADLEAYITNGTPKTLISPGPGHNAWMMVSSALVLFMTLPGLALFYGGLVRSRGWS